MINYNHREDIEMKKYKIKYTFIDDIVADTKDKAIEIFENFIYNTEDYSPDIVTIEEIEEQDYIVVEL